MTGVQLIPSAKRLIQSLRDMGYDFAQAIADIIDNSIEAKASSVSIDIEFDGDDSWVRIADNGKGMQPEELREAMRYGAERDYRDEDLGKFGLGLKTASMSQCQRLSVASRWNPSRADIAAYAWDLDHIAKTNRWEILPIERSGIGPAIRNPLKEMPGTVVLWQRLDRILGYKHPYGETARKRLSQMCREVEQHLGMVFHRFLTGDARRRRLALQLNGNPVPPWDPFCRSEQKTKMLQEVKLALSHEGVEGDVVLQPYILPRQEEFSTLDAFHLASGPNGWNQQQGFYIYRAGRMIQSGGWSNLRAPDEHTKLARIAVYFSPLLDEAFKINVAKMRVQLPAQLREAIRDAVTPVVKLAREIYDKKSSQASHAHPPKPSTTPQPPAPRNSAIHTSSTMTSPNTARSTASRDDLMTLDEWVSRTLSAATDDERIIVERVLNRVLSECEGA